MHSHRYWVILALTWLFCSGAYGDDETELDCDDKSVEDVVDSALSAYNKELKDGAQLALYQIHKATKAQNESGHNLLVDFTARETDCAAGVEKSWKECNYLQDASKALRHCHGKALLTDTVQIFLPQCSVESSIQPNQRPPCLGCPERIDVENVDLMESLTYSVLTANAKHDHTHHFLLDVIAEATRQVVAGFRYRLRFDMQKSNCSKADFKELTEECQPDDDNNEHINCNSTVDVAPWRHELPDTNVHCEPGPLPAIFTQIRKRPPGWSPLRNAHNFYVKNSKKKESSEESHETKQTTDAPTKPPNTNPTTATAPIATNKVPTMSNVTFLKCPSKPWKEFNVKPVRPPPPPPRPPSNKVQVGILQDTDLLLGLND